MNLKCDNDFSIKRAKILTNQLNFIEETLSLSCDGVVFPVRVREFRFSFWSTIDLAESNVAKLPKPHVRKAGDSSDSVTSVYSDFSSSLQPFYEADKVDKCSVVARLADGVRAFQTMDEVDDTANKECFNEPTSSKECFNELIPEIGFINVGDGSNVFLKDRVLLDVAALEGLGGSSGNENLLCHNNFEAANNSFFSQNSHACSSSYVLQAGLVADSHSRCGNVSVQTPMVFLGSSLRVDEFEGVHGLVLLNSHSRDHVEQFASSDMDFFQCVTQTVLSDRAREDILSMGLLNEADDEVCEMVPCDNDGISWAESVDRAMNAKFGWNEVIAQDTVLEMGSINFFFLN
ncbi:hypothetical protein V6N13_083608 [Hibiscus sabdariffa]|uniref:Uncharacterized protein n=1 Tax=Hibiscus sabdariffa TaxID=183260 RepID=A0ABR2SZC0_9ROSI